MLGVTQFWITLPAEGPARGSRSEKVLEVKADGWAEMRGRRNARRAVECMMNDLGRNAGKRQRCFSKTKNKTLSTYNLEFLLYSPFFQSPLAGTVILPAHEQQSSAIQLF